MSHTPVPDDPRRRPSEGSSGYGTEETGLGGADSVPDTPDALPHEPGQPERRPRDANADDRENPRT